MKGMHLWQVSIPSPTKGFSHLEQNTSLSALPMQISLSIYQQASMPQTFPKAPGGDTRRLYRIPWYNKSCRAF